MEELSSITEELKDKFRGYTVEEKWDDVITMCRNHSELCKLEIKKSRGTALHVAVCDGAERVVERLVEVIKDSRKEEAFEVKNVRGNTPLHLAAYRGFRDICECIIGTNGERKNLINIHNKEGETPLFYAALACQKHTFMYLCSMIPRESASKDLIRNDGDSILHCAIRREFFDLALIIMYKYPVLRDLTNDDGFTPLKLLATRPSAFKSGSKMAWWKRILYHCIHAENVDLEKAEELYKKKEDKAEKNIPENYRTCYRFFRGLLGQLPFIGPENVRGESEVPQKDGVCKISMPEDYGGERVPQNYGTCLQFVKFAYMYCLGISGVGIEDMRKMKQKHKWSVQLLSLYMKNPYESYMGTGGAPARDESDEDETDFTKVMRMNEGKDKQSETSTTQANPQAKNKIDSEETAIITAMRNSIPEIVKEILSKIPNAIQETKSEKRNKIDGEEPALLLAARNGIVEMVIELLSKIPNAIHETNSEKKNVLLVAVENKQPLVVEALRNYRFGKEKSNVIFNNLMLAEDNHGNTMLHLAATPGEKGWHIAGAALQMMWQIKWFQYIKDLVPEHFTVRTNDKDQTAGEIFKESHKDLVKDGGSWLKDTSESCSVVAALITGVSFATCSSIPGGNKSETGEPALEGKPAFEAFGISSVFGLCFSVTALIMFLSILTSRKETKDFNKDLPIKLFLGLSSLFLSIAAMFVSFCSGNFFVIENKFKEILFLIYGVTCLPVSLYAVAQFPLYTDLLKAITKKVPQPSDKSGHL